MSEEKDTVKEKIYYDQRSVALRTPQSVYFVKEHDKEPMLGLILDEHKETQVVIVVKSKKKADALGAFLISKEFKAKAVHGNHREAQQKEAAAQFNDGSLNVIITTDMILKTLGLENIKLILSHDLCDEVQDYYDRLALMREKGVAIALIGPEDEVLLSDIEFNMKVEIEENTLEGFVPTDIPVQTAKTKKDRKKKPRHRKNKVRKEKEA